MNGLTENKIVFSKKRVFKRFDSFLKFYTPNRSNIEQIRVKPARLGQPGFGTIEVKVKNPYLNV